MRIKTVKSSYKTDPYSEKKPVNYLQVKSELQRSYGTEHAEQCVIFEWAGRVMRRRPELFLLHATPNGAKLPYKKVYSKKAGGMIRVSPEAKRLLAEGMKPGVPDIHLPVPVNGYPALWIELKVKSNYPDDDQKAWIDYLQRQGHAVYVCYGAAAAQEIITKYMDGEL